MAYTLIEGFDYYGSQSDLTATPQWPVLPNNTAITFVPGFFNHGRAMAIPNTASSAWSIICEPASAASEVFIAFDVLLEALPTTNPSQLLACREGSSFHTNIAITTSGAIRMRRATTQLGTDSTFTFALNTRYRFELRTVIADSGGLIEVRIDGTSVASVSNVDTRDGGTSGVVSRVELRGMIQSSSAGNTIFDNLTVNDTTGAAPTSWPGARRIETIFPNGDDSVQWTPSQGSLNYDLINDATPDLLTWVQSNTANQVDRYDLQDLSGTPTAIDAVQLVTRAGRSDTGARTMRGFIRSGTTTANGATFTPVATPSGQYVRDTWHTDPDTNAAWTAAGVNALKAGVEVVS
jgi:hypothetical protein